jgi:hypothetical protein
MPIPDLPDFHEILSGVRLSPTKASDQEASVPIRFALAVDSKLTTKSFPSPSRIAQAEFDLQGATPIDPYNARDNPVYEAVMMRKPLLSYGTSSMLVN